MDTDYSPEGSGATTDEDRDILNALNSEFKKSKAEQIFRFLQDQEELSQKFKEYALDSEEDAECGSDGSISEAENRLSQQLDLRRARPANPPHSAWSELTGPGDGVFLTDNPDSTDTPHRSTVNNHSSHVEGVSGSEKTHKPKRKGGSHSSDYTKPKRTLSKVSTRPQTAVGLKTISELSSSFPIQLSSSRQLNSGLLDDKLIENHDRILRSSHQRAEDVSRSGVNPASSAGKKGRNRNKNRVSGSGSGGQSHPLHWSSSDSADFLHQHSRDVTSGGANFMDLTTGHVSASGRLRLGNRHDFTAKKLITLDVGQSGGSLQGQRHLERPHLDGRNSVTSGRKSAGLYHSSPTGSGAHGRLMRAPVLSNISGMEQAGRNMTVLKLPPLDNSVVTSQNLPNNAMMNNPTPASLNPTHVS